MTTDETNELDKLRRAVEATEMIQTGLRNAIVERLSIEGLGAKPTDSECYCLGLATQQVQLVRADYRAACLRLRALTDCSKFDPGQAPDRSSGNPAANS